MSNVLERIKLALSVAVLGAASLVLKPGGIVGQGGPPPEPPCYFDDDKEFDCYKDKKHIYQTSCEGIDCYYKLEKCC
ncbi:MAG: hypothetical protein ACRENP_05430 [Longimicrobiales bacterium]